MVATSTLDILGLLMEDVRPPIFSVRLISLSTLVSSWDYS